MPCLHQPSDQPLEQPGGVVVELQETLHNRVNELIEISKSNEPFLTSTPYDVRIGELASRIQGLETAVRLIATEVHRLAAATRERV